ECWRAVISVGGCRRQCFTNHRYPSRLSSVLGGVRSSDLRCMGCFGNLTLVQLQKSSHMVQERTFQFQISACLLQFRALRKAAIFSFSMCRLQHSLDLV